MTCRQHTPQTDVWRSVTMRAASDLVERIAPPPPPHEWRSSTMQTLEAAVTPGTTANFAVTFTVTTLLIPRIPYRPLAMAVGFAAGSILH